MFSRSDHSLLWRTWWPDWRSARSGAKVWVGGRTAARDATSGVAGSAATYAQLENCAFGSPGMEGVALRYGFFYGPDMYHDLTNGSVSTAAGMASGESIDITGVHYSTSLPMGFLTMSLASASTSMTAVFEHGLSPFSYIAGHLFRLHKTRGRRRREGWTAAQFVHKLHAEQAPF